MNNFIPKPYKKESISIRVDIEKLESIDVCCAKYNVNRSEFINRCIDFSLSQVQQKKIYNKK